MRLLNPRGTLSHQITQDVTVTGNSMGGVGGVRGGGCAHHYLCVPIREGSCCITADWVLAVSQATSESVLDLKKKKKKKRKKEEKDFHHQRFNWRRVQDEETLQMRSRRQRRGGRDDDAGMNISRNASVKYSCLLRTTAAVGHTIWTWTWTWISPLDAGRSAP